MDLITEYVKYHHPSVCALSPQRINLIRALLFTLLWVIFSVGIIILTAKTTLTENHFMIEQNAMPPIIAWHPLPY